MAEGLAGSRLLPLFDFGCQQKESLRSGASHSLAGGHRGLHVPQEQVSAPCPQSGSGQEQDQDQDHNQLKDQVRTKSTEDQTATKTKDQGPKNQNMFFLLFEMRPYGAK